MHTHDYIERLRKAILPAIGRQLAELGEPWRESLKVKLETDADEFAFVWGEPEEAFEFHLHELGFVRNPLSAWKTVVSDAAPEQGSWAWRGDPHSFVRDPWADGQLHVILFEVDGRLETTAVFAHWEYSWLTHPIKHYRGHATEDGHWGAGAALLRELFAERVDRFDEISHQPRVEDLLASVRSEPTGGTRD